VVQPFKQDEHSHQGANFIARRVVILTDTHNILDRWRNYFSQLLNVRGVSDVRQTEIHTAEPSVPDRRPFEVEIAIAKLKRHTSPVPAELF
jgi:hypothetical protein